MPDAPDRPAASSRHRARGGPAAACPAARAARGLRRLATAAPFILPSLAGVLLFLLIPVVIVLVLSFIQWNFLTPPRWVGLANFSTMVRDDHVFHALLNTAYYVLLNIPAQTVLALLLALALNRRMRGSKFFRVVFVLPWMAMPVALGVIWNWFFDPRSGIIDHLISMLGFTGPNWLTSSAWAMPVVASVNVWQYTGYTMLFLLAGLQAIPQTVRGGRAGRRESVQRFSRITLPLLTSGDVLRPGHQRDRVVPAVRHRLRDDPGRSRVERRRINYYIYQQAFQLFHAG